MSQRTQDKVREFKDRVLKALKETRDEESKSTYVLVKTRNVQALSTGLGVIINMEANTKVKEMLLDLKAGLDWVIENNSIAPAEAARVKRKNDAKSA